MQPNRTEPLGSMVQRTSGISCAAVDRRPGREKRRRAVVCDSCFASDLGPRRDRKLTSAAGERGERSRQNR